MNTPTSLRLGRDLSLGLSLILCLSFFTACKSQQTAQRDQACHASYSGQEILPHQFKKIGILRGNYVVQQGNLIGLYDTNEKEIVPCKYTDIAILRNHYLVQQGNRKGLYDLSGKEIVPCKYKNIAILRDHYLVQQGNRKGLYDLSGKEIMPCKYKNITMYRGEWRGKM